MGLPGVSSTSLLEVLFHLLQVTGTTPAQGLKQQQSWAETPDCNSGTQHPLAERGLLEQSGSLDTVGVGLRPNSARLDVPGCFKSAEDVSCVLVPAVMSPGRAVGTLPQGYGGGYSQRGSIYHPLWVLRRDAREQHPGQGGGSCSTQSSCLAPQLRKVMDFIPLLLWPQFGFREDRQASPKPAALHISK